MLSPSVFDVIDWFVEVVGAPSTKKFDGSVVGSLVGSIYDVVWIIDGFLRNTEVDMVEKMFGELEGADVSATFNGTEGSVVEVGLSVCSIVEG